MGEYPTVFGGGLPEKDASSTDDLQFAGGRRGGDTSVPVGMSLTGNTLHIEIDLPGVAEETIEVTIEGSSLDVSGTRERSGPPNAVTLMDEQRRGRLSRQIRLPVDQAGIDLESVTSTFSDGVLHIEVAARPPGPRFGGGKKGAEESGGPATEPETDA